uniref:Uncharacterized protein n=1 Tax=Alexandrium andersonii TaxID=327968 RepID=A0A7S2DYE8_9DINO|mmetsp:Transcript_6178/g.14069  ORF Transcript_6178/g.14069 Transcript_6178/m.14069 type:complete len:385 (+) Transcript_6178:92-1246(+)
MPCVSDEQRRSLLLWTGVKLSKDGKSIFNYNPGIFQAGLNFLVALPFLPGFLNRAHVLQLLGLYCIMQVYMWLISTATADGAGKIDRQVHWCYDNIAGLARFVLGLFVSLVLSKTYYANRGVFGTVFGCSMGLAEMTVSWVRPPPRHAGNTAAKDSAKRAQELIVRWINAGFRLMWLEAVPGKVPDAIGEDMVKEGLLTTEEWTKVKALSSRCTHVYQWISNVLTDLYDKGYIASTQQLVQMCTQVDNMRGANVWGLPSLPIAYTQIITHMVKLYLLVLTCENGALASEQVAIGNANGYDWETVFVIVMCHADLALHNYLWQGMLDLHGGLYNPNSGTFLGHLPALNFMVFVRDVTEHLVSENDSLPYSLELAELEGEERLVKM